MIALSLGALLISAWLVAAHVQAKTINRCVIRPHTVCAKRNLHAKNLAGAHLAYANLTDANLSGSNLRRADLRHANLTGANLSNANLAGANMTRANLNGAILTGVSLASVTLTGVRSGGITRGPARMPPGYVLRQGYLLKILATPVLSLSSGPQRVILNRFGPVPGAVGYAAQLCDAPGLNCEPAVGVTTAGHTFTGLSGEAIYTVKLTAIGNGTTTASSRTSSRRAVAGSASPRAIQLATPSLTLTPGPGSLTIAGFSAVPNALGYSAQRCDAAGNNCQAPVSVSTAGYTYTGLTGGTTYTITLAAIGDGTAYANSRAASMTGAPGAVLLAAPSFSVTPGPYLVTLNPFGTVPHATSYAAQLCGSTGAHCQSAISVTTAGFNFTGLAAGTTYTVTLTAIGDGTVYANSATASQIGTAWWACLVIDATRSEPDANTLQAAIVTAQSGDTLKVYGTCHGITTISEDLTIAGLVENAFGAPTLNGDNVGPVVAITGGTVRISGLTITGGRGLYADRPGGAGGGGGIYNAGTLVLTDARVVNNTTEYGGAGGGVFNDGSATLISSSVLNNGAYGGGGGIVNLGTMQLNSTSVLDNKSAVGGGIANGGTLLLVNRSNVAGNWTGKSGGGGISNSGTVELANSTITGNSSSPFTGGGILNAVGGTLINCIPGVGGNVFNNTPDDIVS